MKKLQALETYQQLMTDNSSSSSGLSDKQLQRQAGDTPSQVSAKIAADKDQIPLLDAAILIAQVSCSQLSEAAAAAAFLASSANWAYADSQHSNRGVDYMQTCQSRPQWRCNLIAA
jgi:hypothetical protein